MRRFAACGLFVSLAIFCVPTTSQSVPMKLAVCEGFSLGVWLCGGVWTFNGNTGKAQWPNDATADLVLEGFDNEQVTIRRTDTWEKSLGVTAVYTGKRNGHRLDGQVTYSWPGHWPEPKKGTWSATIDSVSDSRPSASATAHARGGFPDLNGVWQLVQPGRGEPKNYSSIDAYTSERSNQDNLGSKNTAPAVAIIQHDSDVTLVLVIGGHPRSLTFRGHIESSSLISGHSCDSSPSKDDPFCLLETLTTTILDPTHVKDSVGNQLEKVAGREDPRYTQSLLLVPTKGAKPYLPEQPFDLTGTWQYANQRGAGSRIQIKQNNGLVDMWGAFGGYPFFTGWYSRNPAVGGTAMARGSKDNDLRWTPSTLFLESPDTIRMTQEGNTAELYRLTAPAPHDLPCDADNRFHVSRYYAWVRGQVAVNAKDTGSARCWAMLSANQGLPAGQSLLAALLIQANPPDYQKAFDLSSKSAQAGDIGGQLELASLYREGKGTAADPAKAKFWAAQAQHSKDIALWQGINKGTQDMFGMSPLELAGRALAVGAVLGRELAADNPPQGMTASKGWYCAPNCGPNP
jgi:hypothetical protein